MKCKRCGQEFISILSSICPYCGTDNSVTFSDFIFGNLYDQESKKNKTKSFDPYDFDDDKACSDNEYMDDDDYDDFDNF